MKKTITMTTRIGRLMAGAGIAALVAGFAGYQSATLEAATTQTASFNISANVAANCTIVAGNLGFASYDPVVANATNPLDQTSPITVACTKGTSATVSLDLGTHASGSTRRMQNGTTATEFLTIAIHHCRSQRGVEHDQYGGVAPRPRRRATSPFTAAWQGGRTSRPAITATPSSRPSPSRRTLEGAARDGRNVPVAEPATVSPMALL